MGEIGRDRKEYLYDMMWWEILLIIRGYRRRNVLQYQLQRLQAYGSVHCMGGAKKEPHEWLPLYFDKYKEHNVPEVTLDDIRELEAENAAIEAAIKRERESSEA